MEKIKMVLAAMAAAIMGLGAGGAAEALAADFPDANAGIGAYIKLKTISQADFTRAYGYFDRAELWGDHYLIGAKEYATYHNNNIDYGKTNFRIYLGADGWLAVYLPKDQALARIVDLHDGAVLQNTMLKKVIEDAMDKIQLSFVEGQSIENIKYYDFGKSGASKMTLVKESIPAHSVDANNVSITEKIFSATIKTDLKQLSWAIRQLNGTCDIAPVAISMDNYYSIGYTSCNTMVYGNFLSLALFNNQQSHLIKLKNYNGDIDSQTALVFLY